MQHRRPAAAVEPWPVDSVREQSRVSSIPPLGISVVLEVITVGDAPCGAPLLRRECVRSPHHRIEMDRIVDEVDAGPSADRIHERATTTAFRMALVTPPCTTISPNRLARATAAS